MPVLYKDFNKDVKDIFTKNVAEGKWTLESKYKGADQVVFINPNFNTKDAKGLSATIEYNCKKHGLKTKAIVADDLKASLRVGYDKDGQKVEVFGTPEKKYEVVYEGKFGSFWVEDKVTNTSAEGSVSFAITPEFSAGAGATYSIKDSKLTGWSAGLLFKDKNYFADLTTDSLKVFTLGAKFPALAIGAHAKLTFAAQCAYTLEGGKIAATAGVETPCPLGCEGLSLKARVNNTGAFAVTAIRKFADSWKAGVSYESKSKKVGVTFTRE